MDISSIIGNLAIGGIFTPLVYALYLAISRLRLSLVPKFLLNSGCTIANLISLIIFSYCAIKNNFLNLVFIFFETEKFELDFGILIDEKNILFLIFVSFISTLISLYSKIYFNRKKQYIFTKQRFYLFLSLLSFLIYLFISSANLIQATLIFILISILVFFFSYFDIFKNPTNFNITRFNRISQVGNISLVLACLILFRYSILSQGYIVSNSLDYEELNSLISYTYGISSPFEFKLMAICFVVTILTRLTIFPFSCYYSFFANSSNVMYLSTFALANNIIGIFLLERFLPLLKMFAHLTTYLEIFLIISIVLSLVQILFEKNIKIIFGYLICILNSTFMILYLNSESNYIRYSYFALNVLLCIILMTLFFKNKVNIKKRLINKQLGFVLEKSHIILFENLPVKIANAFEIIYEKLIEKITLPIIYLFDFLCTLFIIKTAKINSTKYVKFTLIIIALVVLFAIFIALFGGFDVN